MRHYLESREPIESNMIEAKITPGTCTTLQAKDWDNRTLAELIQHIIAAHHQYLREEFPALETLLTHSSKGRSEPQTDSFAGLIKIFRQFRRGMEEHMKREESVLFPMIEKLESARAAGLAAPRWPFGSIGRPIEMMEQEHDRARKELAEIRTLTSDYTSIPTMAAEQSSTLDKLKALDGDMDVHSRLEDEILFPRAIALERI
jgi:regulator of cell morphogenesis and NO signaling